MNKCYFHLKHILSQIPPHVTQEVFVAQKKWLNQVCLIIFTASYIVKYPLLQPCGCPQFGIHSILILTEKLNSLAHKCGMLHMHSLCLISCFLVEFSWIKVNRLLFIFCYILYRLDLVSPDRSRCYTTLQLLHTELCNNNRVISDRS